MQNVPRTVEPGSADPVGMVPVTILSGAASARDAVSQNALVTPWGPTEVSR